MGVFLASLAALCLLGLTTGQATTNNFYCNSAGGTSTSPTTTHVAFSVARDQDFVPSATARVPFNVILYNRGGHFDTTTNIFTVPVTGLYSVYFGGVGDARKLTYLTLYAGNPEVPVARTYDYTQGHGSAGVRVLLELKKDDTVSVWMHQNGNRYGLDGNLNSNFFNAYLIHPL